MAHPMIQMLINLTKGQMTNGFKTKQLAISQMLFHIQTSYLMPRYNKIILDTKVQQNQGHSITQVADDLDIRSRSNYPKNG